MSRRLIAWIVIALAVLAAVIAVSAIWNGLWAWLPWSAESRADRAEARAAVAEDQALASSLEAEGQGEQVRRVDTYAHQIITVQAATATAAAAAREAPDAETPLDSDRADRLRDHDRELCQISPDLAGCDAAPDPAGGRGPVL